MEAVGIGFGTIVALIVVALAFDFMNGFHDAANSIATIVSTRVLRPRYAVIWASFFNFIAFLIMGTRVAKTIGGDLVRCPAQPPLESDVDHDQDGGDIDDGVTQLPSMHRPQPQGFEDVIGLGASIG